MQNNIIPFSPPSPQVDLGMKFQENISVLVWRGSNVVARVDIYRDEETTLGDYLKAALDSKAFKDADIDINKMKVSFDGENRVLVLEESAEILEEESFEASESKQDLGAGFVAV